ncbi:MAG: hypothetical protein IKO97_01405, partial [Erysipelotrichaceae bacterium]|nr:hypothetical protein [Erysipelotrichaceae bacterium]
MKKLVILIITVFFITGLASRPVYADMGPKPSVTINISNPPEGTYYVTLLGLEEYGPWSFVNEENMDAIVADEQDKEA